MAISAVHLSFWNGYIYMLFQIYFILMMNCIVIPTNMLCSSQSFHSVLLPKYPIPEPIIGILAMSSASIVKIVANAIHDNSYQVKLKDERPPQHSPSFIHYAENPSNNISFHPASRRK